MPIAAAIPALAAIGGGSALAGGLAVAGTAATVAGTISSINANKKMASAAQTAVDRQSAIAGDLKYAPINIEKLRADATAQAIQNATQSLALERSLQPDVAATRAGLASSVNSELQQGGNLPADVANKVAMEARTINARSGSQDAASPLTASLIGLTSLDLLRTRQAAASNLLAANPLQPTGLDPGAAASLEVAENAAQNDFNMAKAGVSSNVARGQGGADAAQIGADASVIPAIGSALTSVASLFRPKPAATNYENLLSKTSPVFNYTMPKVNYSLLGGATPVS